MVRFIRSNDTIARAGGGGGSMAWEAKKGRISSTE